MSNKPTNEEPRFPLRLRRQTIDGTLAAWELFRSTHADQVGEKSHLVLLMGQLQKEADKLQGIAAVIQMRISVATIFADFCCMAGSPLWKDWHTAMTDAVNGTAATKPEPGPDPKELREAVERYQKLQQETGTEDPRFVPEVRDEPKPKPRKAKAAKVEEGRGLFA